MAAIWRTAKSTGKSSAGLHRLFLPSLSYSSTDPTLLSSPTGQGRISTTAGQQSKPYEHNDSLEFIATSFKKCLAHVGPWTIGDLSFGIRALYDRHKEMSADIKGSPIKDIALLQGWVQEIEIADAIYEHSIEGVAAGCQLGEDDIKEFHANADRLRPAFCIAVRQNTKEILLVVRGTRTPADAITILTGSAAEFQGGYTHAGMLHSAEWLLHHKTDTLTQLLEQHPGFHLRFIGHSLGAGAAALYALMLRQRHEAGKFKVKADQLPTCLAIATPACATQEIVDSCRDFVTSVVCQNDVVPRASLYAFERLRMDVKETDWQKELDEMVDEALADWSNRLSSNAIAKQYRRMSELVTASYPGTAKLIDAVGDAWEELAKSTSLQYSGTISNMLRKSSTSLARLPASGSSSRQPIDALPAPPELAKTLRAHTQQEISNVREQREKGSRKSKASGGVSRSREETGVLRGNGEDERGRGKGRERGALGEAQEQASWWGWISSFWGSKTSSQSSSQHASEQSRSEDMQQIGKDIQDIARLYSTSNEADASADQPIPLASDGELDAELAHMLLSMDEAEERNKNERGPLPKMYPPGKLVFLKRISGSSADGTYQALAGDEGETVGRILLSKSMITDHLCTTYIAAVKSCVSQLE